MVSSPRRSTDDAKEAFADALEGGKSSGAFGPEDEVVEGSLGGGETGGAFGPCVFKDASPLTPGLFPGGSSEKRDRLGSVRVCFWDALEDDDEVREDLIVPNEVREDLAD